MNQIVIGAALPYLVCGVIYACHRARASLALLIVGPLAMTACAIWAVIPDIPRALGMQGLYGRLAHDPRTDIFLMHYTIDQLEVDSILYTVAFVLMTLSIFMAAWREVRLREAAGGGRP